MRARLKRWLAANGDEGLSRRRRRITKWFAAALLSLFMIFVVVPTSIKWSIEYWLHDRGHIEADIGGLWFNLFTGRLSLSAVAAGKSGAERLDFTIADANMDWLPLFGKKFFLNKIELADATFDIKREDDGTIIAGGIELKVVDDDREEPAQTPDEDVKPWGVGTGPIDLTNVRFLYSDPDLSAELLIHSLHVDPMASWEPDNPTAITLDIEINGERATFSGVALPFATNPQLEGQLKIERFSLAWIAAALVKEGITALEGDIHIDGFVHLMLLEEGGGREASFEGKTQLKGFAIEREGLEASLGALSVDGKVTDSLMASDGVTGFSGMIALGEFSLEAKAGQASFSAFSVDGDSAISIDREGKVSVSHKGGLELKEIAASSAGQSASVGLTKLDMDTAFSLDREGRGGAFYEGAVLIERALAVDEATQAVGGATRTSVETHTMSGRVDATFAKSAENFELNLDAALSTNTRSAKVEQATVDKATVDWRGKVAVTVASGVPTVKTGGELAVLDFSATVTEPAVEVAHKSLVWKGDGGFTGTGEDFTPSARGGVTMADLQVRRAVDDGVLLALKRLALSGLAIDGFDDIGFDRVILEGVKGLARSNGKKGTKGKKEPDHVALLKAMTVEGVKLTELSRIETKLVSVDSLALWVERDAEGEFEALGLLPKLSGAKGGSEKKQPADTQKEAANKAPKGGSPPTFSLGKLEMVGDNSVAFSDTSLSPAYKTKLSDILFKLENLDSADAVQPASVNLSAVADKYGTIALTGRGLPFAELPTGTASVKLEGINLAPLTSYSNRYIGYRLVSGLMDFEADADVNAGEVVATLHTHINKLEMETLHPDEQDEFTQELGVPVTLALALLTDKNDDIDLEIPVEGNLNDPEFGIGDIVGQLTKKATVAAIKVAAVTYFAPLGAIFALGKIFDLATALSIAPVDFEAGRYDINPEALSHMGTMVELFDNRPGIRLQLCGVAAYPDREHFARELMQQKLAELDSIARKMAKTAPEELVEAMTPLPEAPPLTGAEAGAEVAAQPTTAAATSAPVAQKTAESAPISPAVVPVETTAIAATDATDATDATAAAAPPEPRQEWIVGVQVYGPPLPPEVPNEMLFELAGGRTDSVRDYLAGQGLDPKRLLPCSPEIAHDAETAPQTRVSIDTL